VVEQKLDVVVAVAVAVARRDCAEAGLTST